MASRDVEDRRLRRTSIAWSYFTLVDEEKRVASCNTCDSHMSFRSSISNLMKHLKRKHSDIVPRIPDEEKDSDCEADEATEAAKAIKVNLDEDEDKLQSSLPWEHFQITNPEKKIATCSMCQLPLSFRSSVQALRKHLKRKHNIGDDEDVQSEDEDKNARADSPPADYSSDIGADSPPAKYRSAIWSYFRVMDMAGKVARCLVCRKSLSYNTSTSNLRKHLQRKHPLIKLPAPGEERKTIILSSGDQLYEYEVGTPKGEGKDDDDHDDAQTEPIAIDEVFLDEFNGSVNRLETKYKSRKRKHKEKKQIILEPPSDSEDEPIFKKKYEKKETDSIDLFAKYIASLLKELPKQISNRLQKDFVQQIMNAQVDEQVRQDAYSITIAPAANSAPNDVRYEVITTKPDDK